MGNSTAYDQYQAYANSTELIPFYEPRYGPHYTYLTETDDALKTIIKHAHQIGLKVMMKLHVDLYDDDSHWRGDIGYNFDDDTADKWFGSYAIPFLRYAKMSQQLGVEAFSVSCELIAMSVFEKQWRALIFALRNIYSGQVTSSSNWGYLDERGGEDTKKTWWDAVDFIGIDAYYDYDAGLVDPTLEQLLTAYQGVVNRLESLATKWKKKVVLTELGYCSGQCKRDHVPVQADFDRQALYYQVPYISLSDKEWFDGLFWWSWNSDPRSGGFNDDCITPQHKPSEKVIRQYYGGTETLPILEGNAKCQCTV